LIGDVVHCPVELTQTDWEIAFDVDLHLAARSGGFEYGGLPAAAAHFTGLQFGSLLSGASGRRWTYGSVGQ
jgi:hypothetical protein